MIPYGMQNIDESDIEAVVEALHANLITTGPLVEKFESALTSFNGAETFVVNSGTAALHCAYFGIGVSPGDEVITPPNTFIATQAAAANLGAKIIFADIELDTGLISIDSVREKISDKTKAIVLVDYAGQPCDIDAFRDLINNRPIFLIEDAAHSFGSKYKGEPVGSSADVTTFSFYPTKNITTGEGGAVSSKNPNILKRAKRFARQGLVRDKSEFLLIPEGLWHQEVHEFGLNYRLTDFQCSLGLSQLSRVKTFKDKRTAIFEQYMRNLENCEQIRTIKVHEYSDVMWHLFPIFVKEEFRAKLVNLLKINGIGTQVNYFPANRHPVFVSNEGFSDLSPEADKFYAQEISLPMHVNLELESVNEICKVILQFIEEVS
jgi:dTDP-4-amino-4,6-dideoxygalactose transaminase